MDEYNTRSRNRNDEYDEGNYPERSDGNLTNLSRMDSIQDPGKRFVLKNCIGSGVCGDVYEAIDENSGKHRKLNKKLLKIYFKLGNIKPNCQIAF